MYLVGRNKIIRLPMIKSRNDIQYFSFLLLHIRKIA